MNQDKAFFVVGVGASAGGLEAIQAFFSAVPPLSGMAFIVVQHLSPTFKSLMDELLLKYTPMPIITAEDGMVIEPDHVYLNRRDKNLLVKNGIICLTDRDAGLALHLPIDDFFHSLGEAYEEHAVAVILSGTGSDGSRGIRTVKEAGGTIMVQDPETAQFDGMPNSAIRTNLPDIIGPPSEIAQSLLHLGKRDGLVLNLGIKHNDTVFSYILQEASRGSGIDFERYKPNTLARRIQKRMDLRACVSLDEYLVFLRHDDLERQRLAQEFLIGVTAFFRDEEAYALLTKLVLPELIRVDKDTLRIWVSACSTGEEAYSLAILLDELGRSSGRHGDYKIFATDVDADAIARAASGLFPISIMADVSKERISNYFVKNGDHYQIIKRIRERIVFSRHNLLKDPPFIRMDLISCRNVLIYFKPETQGQILGKLLFSLNEGGFLFLGSSESLGSYQDFFRVVDQKWRLFQNTTPSKVFYRNFIGSMQENKRDTWIQRSSPVSKDLVVSQGLPSRDSIMRVLADFYTPSCIMFDKDWNVLYIKGDIRTIMRIREGEFSTQLTDMLDEAVAAVFRNAVRQLEIEKKSLTVEKIPCVIDAGLRFFDIRFRVLPMQIKVYLAELITVQDQIEDTGIITSYRPDEISQQRINELEHELATVNVERQNIIEELETSNEELQSSNEELLASNEELQSTNEELQSVNEELYTVNSELQQRNREVSDLYADMNNLLMSTQIATLFLDENLCIRKFTPQLRDLFRLEDNDIGRSIHDFANNFSDFAMDRFTSDASDVLLRRIIIRRELTSRDGRFFLERMSPFEREGHGGDGVVITFVDITEPKREEKKMAQVHETLKSALIVANIAWWDWNIEENILMYDPKKAAFLGMQPEEIPPGIYGFIERLHPDDKDLVMKNMEQHLQGLSSAYDVEYRIQHKDGHYIWLRDRGAVSSWNHEGKAQRVVGAVFDITEHHQLEDALSNRLKGKEHILQEVHHQIKNNLQRILSIMDLQALKIENKDLREAFDLAKNRIMVMAIIHEHLNTHDTESRVEISGYLRKLSASIVLLHDRTIDTSLIVTVPELYLDFDSSVCHGLIVNELLSNFFKHAGDSDLRLLHIKYLLMDQALLIQYQDAGPGLPVDFEERRKKTLGMSLLNSLVGQLGGSLSFGTEHGAWFRIMIPFTHDS